MFKIMSNCFKVSQTHFSSESKNFAGAAKPPALLLVTGLYDTHTPQEPGSLFWCHAVMSM